MPERRQEREAAGETASSHSASRAATILVLLALLYPLSLGPACWTMSRLQLGRRSPHLASGISQLYDPLAPLVIYGPTPIRVPLRWWISAGMASSTVYHSLPDGIAWNNPGYSWTLWHY